MPNYGKDYALWHGEPPKANDIKSLYQVDQVFSFEELESHLKVAKKIHVLEKEESILPQATTETFKTYICLN